VCANDSGCAYIGRKTVNIFGEERSLLEKMVKIAELKAVVAKRQELGSCRLQSRTIAETSGTSEF